MWFTYGFAMVGKVSLVLFGASSRAADREERGWKVEKREKGGGDGPGLGPGRKEKQPRNVGLVRHRC